MRSLKDILKLTENAKKDEHKPVFKETDPSLPFPHDTVRALKTEINKGAKDLEQSWESALDLVDKSFVNLKVPKPTPSQSERWKQYNLLIGEAVKELYDARGPDKSWMMSK